MRVVALSPLTVLPCSPLEQIDAAREVGFSTVGLRVFPVMETDEEILSDRRRQLQIIKRLRDTDTRVFDIEVLRVTAKLNVDPLAYALDFAAELGARRLAVTSGTTDEHDGEDRAALVDTFHRLSVAAAAREIGVMLEFIPFRHIRTLEQAVRIVKDADHSGLGVTVDALHFFRSGGDVGQLAAVPADLLACAQICDAPGVAPESLQTEARYGRLLPGEGELPLVDFVRSIPPNLPVSAEIPGNQTEPVVERARRAATSTLRLLRSAENRDPEFR